MFTASFCWILYLQHIQTPFRYPIPCIWTESCSRCSRQMHYSQWWFCITGRGTGKAWKNYFYRNLPAISVWISGFVFISSLCFALPIFITAAYISIPQAGATSAVASSIIIIAIKHSRTKRCKIDDVQIAVKTKHHKAIEIFIAHLVKVRKKTLRLVGLSSNEDVRIGR